MRMLLVALVSMNVNLDMPQCQTPVISGDGLRQVCSLMLGVVCSLQI
jgi:hypothetical protein